VSELSSSVFENQRGCIPGIANESRLEVVAGKNRFPQWQRAGPHDQTASQNIFTFRITSFTFRITSFTLLRQLLNKEKIQPKNRSLILTNENRCEGGSVSQSKGCIQTRAEWGASVLPPSNFQPKESPSPRSCLILYI
jgi:hypothetical protein